MRHVTLATRRARQFFRRPPRPRWLRPALYAAGGALGLLLGAGFGIWATSSGLLAEAESRLVARALRLTADAGFAVRQVYVDGRVRTGSRSCASGSGSRSASRSWASTPRPRAQRLEQLTWVDRASVVRMLPDTPGHPPDRAPAAGALAAGRPVQRDRPAPGGDRGGCDGGALPEAYRASARAGRRRRAAPRRAAVRAAVDRARPVRAGGRRDLGRRPALGPASRQSGRRHAARAGPVRRLASAGGQGGSARPCWIGRSRSSTCASCRSASGSGSIRACSRTTTHDRRRDPRASTRGPACTAPTPGRSAAMTRSACSTSAPPRCAA